MCSISTILVAHAQNGNIDFVNAAIHAAVQSYELSDDGVQHYHSGISYEEPPRSDNTHAYFETDDWQPSSIEFDGQWYNNVSILYNVFRDKIITETVNGNFLVINPIKLNSFILNGRTFKKYIKSEKNNLPQSGNYELLYGGRTELIAFRSKQIQEKVENQKIYISYEGRNRYYLLKNGRYFSVKSKKSILNVLSEQKVHLKNLIQKNGISFKNNNEQALKHVAEFYDQLINGKL
jgi:hypothetical protein